MNQSTGATLTATYNVTSPTQITGNVTIPSNAMAGSWNVSVTTIDGGNVWKPSAFTVKQFPAPTITSITPATGTKNSVVAFTLAGIISSREAHRSGSWKTRQTPSSRRHFSMLHQQQLSATSRFPVNVPAGLYRLEVTTVDGGVVSRFQAFTVTYLPLPVMTSLTPIPDT